MAASLLVYEGRTDYGSLVFKMTKYNHKEPRDADTFRTTTMPMFCGGL